METLTVKQILAMMIGITMWIKKKTQVNKILCFFFNFLHIKIPFVFWPNVKHDNWSMDHFHHHHRHHHLFWQRSSFHAKPGSWRSWSKVLPGMPFLRNLSSVVSHDTHERVNGDPILKSSGHKALNVINYLSGIFTLNWERCWCLIYGANLSKVSFALFCIYNLSARQNYIDETDAELSTKLTQINILLISICNFVLTIRHLF